MDPKRLFDSWVKVCKFKVLFLYKKKISLLLINNKFLLKLCTEKLLQNS